MPSPDPASPLAPIKEQFLKIMRWAALFSFAIAALAVILVAQGDSQVRIHMLIATALGVGLSVMLGIALMTLVFLSNRMGQDEGAHRSTTSMGSHDAAGQSHKDDHDSRS